MRQLRVRAIVGLVCCLAGTAVAAPPANDDCENATVVSSLPFTETIDTTEATESASEQEVCASGGGPTVWYTITPSFTGTLCVKTCGVSSYDTVLTSYDGLCNGLGTTTACNDDSCNLQSRILAPVYSGMPLLIEVSRYNAFGTSLAGGPLHIDIVQAGVDGDGDGIEDCYDNCVAAADPTQADGDGDGLGNVCDPCPAEEDPTDLDGDGYCGACALGCDNCPDDANASQTDADGDYYGDACDVCPAVVDPDQQDFDGDAIGDACDPCPADGSSGDLDGDGFCADAGTCPGGCDLCPAVPETTQVDSDGDRVGDACDNCPNVANPEQENWDADPLGNACDPCIEICSGTQCAASGCYDIANNRCIPTNPVPDGTPCNDSNVCTTSDTCQAGLCTGPPLNCGASTTCRTIGTCVAFQGCTSQPAANGTTCDDGNHCTSDDACRLGVCLGTPQDGCPADQFKCYRASGGKPLADVVTYADGFGTAQVSRQPAAQLCNAATDGLPIEDGQRHLTCWRTKQTVSTPRRTVKLKDRFGEGAFTLTKPIAYCAPSEEIGSPSTDPLDEYACYRARGPKRAAQALTLSDQFETRATSVLKPYSVCYPASRDGAPFVDDDAQLVCYKLKEGRTPTFDVHGIVLTSALGGEALRTSKRRLLCVPASKAPCARLTFTSVAGSAQCGGPDFVPPSEPPFVGGIFDATSGGNRIWSLASGCTYFGGGQSAIYPARQQVTGAMLALEADECAGPTLDLRASEGTGLGDCAFGPLDQKVCLNNPVRSCGVDADCGGPAGNCAPIPRCYAAPPQPFRTPQASVCLMSPLAADTTGTVDPTSGALTLTTTTRTLVYLTSIGNAPNPCPRCINGHCDGGQRAGLACTVSASPDQTSLDCPPTDSSFFLSLGPGTQASSTAPRSMSSNAGGLFCPNQLHAGAFGVPGARRIELSGLPAGDLHDGAPHEVSLLDLTCVQTTGTSAADQLADFPGPQATSNVGEVQLTQ